VNKKINVDLRVKYGIISKMKARNLKNIDDYVNNKIKAEEEDVVEYSPNRKSPIRET
jgi:hypothetical protein